MKFSNYYKVPSKNGLSKKFVDDESGTRIVNMKELFAYKILKDDVHMRRVQLSNHEIERFKLEQGDILFGRRSLVEEGAGKSTIYYGTEDTIFESSVIRVRLDKEKANPNFVGYYFESPIGKAKIWSIISGAAVFGIRGTDLANLDVEFPNIKKQNKIAEFITTYDELIENNNQRIKLLEEMAEEIYKEWFVRFRFPNYQNTKIDDGVPEGWGKKMIGALLQQVKRKPKVKKDQYLDDGKFPIIDQSEDIIAGYINDEKYIQKEPLPLIVFGDHTRRVKFVNFQFAAGADGTQLLYPKNKNLAPVYFYQAVKSIDLSNFHYSRHFKFLKKEYILEPIDYIANQFNEIVYPFYKEIDTLRLKNKTLQQTRDLLLPRLISGKLSVENLDIDITKENEILDMAAEPKSDYN